MPRTQHPCLTCGKVFSSKALLQNHFAEEHVHADFKCSFCPQNFPNLFTFKNHLNAHLRNAHSCIICSEVSTTNLQLYTHLTVCHKDRGTPACNLCESSFSNIQRLRQHYKKKHSNSLQSLEQKAEIFCAIHSLRVFPDAALSLDSVLNEDTNSGHSEAVENVASDKPELKEGAHYVCSELNELLLKADEMIAPDHMTIFPELPGHSKEGTHPVVLQVCQPNSVGVARLDARAPLRQLDVLYPERELNQTGPKQSTSGPDRFGFDKQINTQPASFPDNRHVLDYEVKFIEGRQMYVCDVCGTPFEDLDTFYMAHVPIDSYFKTGPRVFTIKSSDL